MVVRGVGSGSDEPTAEPLVKALGVVVLQEFPEQDAKMWFAEDDEVLEAFRSDGPDEALRMGVAVWASSRDGDARHAAGPEKAAPGLAEQGVSVVNEVRRLAKESVGWVEEVSRDLQ